MASVRSLVALSSSHRNQTSLALPRFLRHPRPSSAQRADMKHQAGHTLDSAGPAPSVSQRSAVSTAVEDADEEAIPTGKDRDDNELRRKISGGSRRVPEGYCTMSSLPHGFGVPSLLAAVRGARREAELGARMRAGRVARTVQMHSNNANTVNARDQRRGRYFQAAIDCAMKQKKSSEMHRHQSHALQEIVTPPETPYHGHYT